jgi:hypothetical protein
MNHTFRSGHGETKTKDLKRAEAIKWFCFECMGFQRSLISGCTAPKCALYPFRGSPPRDVEFSDEQRRAMAERLSAVRKRMSESLQAENA